MPFARTLDLFVNVGRDTGASWLRSKTDFTSAGTPEWYAGDIVTIRVWFLQRGTLGAAPTVLAAADGDKIVVAGKKRLVDSTLLFLAEDFTKVGADADLHYEATLNLDTAELAAAFGQDDTVTALTEIEVQNAANTQRITFQGRILVKRSVYTGTESSPVPATPTYPAPAALALLAPTGGAYRIRTDDADGWVFQLKNSTTGTWHTVFVTGAAGSESLAIGPAVS